MRWIVFDGDVDALWVENMNSVMDDNRLLTLPNGERIRLQSHCAMICETYDLQYASPATISRCGMVWVDPQVCLVIFRYEKKEININVDIYTKSHREGLTAEKEGEKERVRAEQSRERDLSSITSFLAAFFFLFFLSLSYLQNPSFIFVSCSAP